MGNSRDVVDLAEVRARMAQASPAMQQLRRLVARIAPATINVLILGETGVGKEVLAETVHRNSRRADRPFLRLNCAALSESLLESELFGHERGSFTGAIATKQGLLETAQGGTVFLDEIGELPTAIQAKLLRVIEERVVLPVGALKPRAIDVRFIAATNRDLAREIDRGVFREDLFYRLNGISLTIPPLRERVNEIPSLARQFIADAWHALDVRGAAPRLSAEALAVLERHRWPGNIRELKNVVERAVLMCSDGVIDAPHIIVDRVRPRRLPSPTLPWIGGAPVQSSQAHLGDSVKREIAKLERQRILDALAQTAGNQTTAAKLLGISRTTLVAKLGLYGIDRPRKKEQ